MHQPCQPDDYYVCMYTAYGTTDGLSSWSRSRTVLSYAAAQIEFSVFVADLGNSDQVAWIFTSSSNEGDNNLWAFVCRARAFCAGALLLLDMFADS